MHSKKKNAYYFHIILFFFFFIASETAAQNIHIHKLHSVISLIKLFSVDFLGFTMILLDSADDYDHDCTSPQTLLLIYDHKPRTFISQYMQTQFPVKLAFAKFLSKTKGNF